MVIFTDTLASMQFFLPSSSTDPSTRVSVKRSFRLLPPIYSLPTWDLCTSVEKQNAIQNMSQLVTMDHIASFGRPLWYISWKTLKKSHPIRIVELARAKIRSGANYNNMLNTEDYKRLFSLAVIGCRAVIHLQPSIIEAVKLVSDFMAINLFVNNDRSRVYVTYGSEPILAEAAAFSWTSEIEIKGIKTTTIFADAIKYVANHVTEGTINMGNQGELAARIILLKAMDKAVTKAYPISTNGCEFTNSVTVGQYLEALIGDDELNDEDNNFIQFCNHYRTTKKDFDHFLNGRICFNHFIQAPFLGKKDEKEMGKKHKQLLFDFAKRLGAMICEPGHTATDMEIPVFLPNPTAQSGSSANDNSISLRYLFLTNSNFGEFLVSLLVSLPHP